MRAGDFGRYVVEMKGQYLIVMADIMYLYHICKNKTGTAFTT